jgi:hypothetical protein
VVGQGEVPAGRMAALVRVPLCICAEGLAAEIVLVFGCLVFHPPPATSDRSAISPEPLSGLGLGWILVTLRRRDFHSDDQAAGRSRRRLAMRSSGPRK